MTVEALWAIVVVGVLVALVVGFLIGRYAGGPGKKADELAAELEAAKEEAASYRKAVDAHFDETATLFVSMAGSYKALFQHLSNGYEKLSDGSARDLFGERVHSLLLGGEADQARLAGDDGRREPALGEAPEDAADLRSKETTDVGESAPAMPDGEPQVEAAPVGEPGLPEAERREHFRG